MRYIFYCLFVTIVFSGSACTRNKPKRGAESEKDKLTSLYVRFMEFESKVKAVAEFKKINPDGMLVRDDMPYKAWFQGRAMDDRSDITGKNYFDLELDYAKPGIFEISIEDNNQLMSSYNLDLSKRGDIDIVGFKAPTGLMINLNQIALREEDELIVVVSDQDYTSSASVKGPSKGQILITQESFQQMKPGPCVIYFVLKSTDQQVTESGRTVVFEREYFFKEKRHELEK